jgi:RNA polymerase sigma-70 factor (ECF subfamily)
MRSPGEGSATGWSADTWIEAARRGDAAGLGRALEPFRDHLKRIACRAIEPALATRIGASDIVQETFLAAQRGASGFRGATEAEWRAWLEVILINRLANLRRAHLGTKKRRAERLEATVDAAGARGFLQEEATSPSRRLMARERDDALEAALSRLPARYRTVVLWRHGEGLGFEAVGTRLGISADAARKLWARALLRLKQTLGPDHDPQ